MSETSYTPNPELPTWERIRAYVAANTNYADFDEVAATLVDEDEAALPGGWEAIGFDRPNAISEYLYEIHRYWSEDVDRFGRAS